MEGGAETPVLEQFAPGDWNNWALTAEGVYYCNFSSKAIEFLSFATQRMTQIAKAEKPPFGGLAASPDGRSILFAQLDRDESHIMLAENFRWSIRTSRPDGSIARRIRSWPFLPNHRDAGRATNQFARTVGRAVVHEQHFVAIASDGLPLQRLAASPDGRSFIPIRHNH